MMKRDSEKGHRIGEGGAVESRTRVSCVQALASYVTLQLTVYGISSIKHNQRRRCVDLPPPLDALLAAASVARQPLYVTASQRITNTISRRRRHKNQEIKHEGTLRVVRRR